MERRDASGAGGSAVRVVHTAGVCGRRRCRSRSRLGCRCGPRCWRRCRCRRRSRRRRRRRRCRRSRRCRCGRRLGCRRRFGCGRRRLVRGHRCIRLRRVLRVVGASEHARDAGENKQRDDRSGNLGPERPRLQALEHVLPIQLTDKAGRPVPPLPGFNRRPARRVQPGASAPMQTHGDVDAGRVPLNGISRPAAHDALRSAQPERPHER